MITTSRHLVFFCMGLLTILWMLKSLWFGKVQTWGRTGIYRSEDPIRFNLWIFYFIILAAIFFSAGIFFYYHPGFTLTRPIPSDLVN